MTNQGSTPVTSVTRAGRREWLGLAVLALPAMVVSMDLTVLHLAIPAISADLQPSSAQLLWIVDVYGLVIAGFLIAMGALGDRVGRKRLLLLGAAAFGAVSVLAAFAPTTEVLITARAVLGIAGATLAPSTLALIRTMFNDSAQRSQAISVWLMSFVLGAAIGPLLGGVLLEWFWWGSTMLIAVPVMVALLLLGPSLLPEHRAVAAPRPDPASVGLSLLAVLAVVYGLHDTAQDGLHLAPLLVAALGLVAGWLFLRRQDRLSDPLIDPALTRIRTVRASLAALTVVMLGIGAVGFLSVQHLQLVLGKSPLQAGLWTLPGLAAGIAATLATPALATRIAPGRIMAGGLAVAAAGAVLLTRVHDGGLPILVSALALIFAGLLPVSTVAIDTVVAESPPERAGAASALSEAVQELGTALGIAMLGSVATAVYRTRLDGPAIDDLAGSRADLARDSLGGLLSAQPPFADQLADKGREAFAQGVQLSAVILAAGLVAAAILTALLLRNVASPAQPEQQPDK